MSRRLICPPLPCIHRLHRYAHPDGIDDDSVYIAPTAAPLPEEATAVVAEGCDTQTSANFLQIKDMPPAIECLTTTSLDNISFCNKEESVTVTKTVATQDTIAPPCVVTHLLTENLTLSLKAVRMLRIVIVQKRTFARRRRLLVNNRSPPCPCRACNDGDYNHV